MQPQDSDKARQADSPISGPVTPAMIVAGVCALGDWLDGLPQNLTLREVCALDRDLTEPVSRILGAALMPQSQAREDSETQR